MADRGLHYKMAGVIEYMAKFGVSDSPLSSSHKCASRGDGCSHRGQYDEAVTWYQKAADLVLEARQTLKVDSSEWRMLDRQREDYLRKVVIMKGQSDRLMYLIQRARRDVRLAKKDKQMKKSTLMPIPKAYSVGSDPPKGLLRERYRELVYENGYYRRLITRYKMMMDVREAMDDDGASSASSCSTDSACSWEEVRDSKPDSTSQV